MHEQQRYALALAGVGGCLCLAAGILLTAPRDLEIPPVDARPVAPAEGLPRVAMPSWSEVTVTPAAAPRVTRVGAVAVAVAESAPAASAASARVELFSVTPVSLEAAAPRVLRGARSSMPVMLPAAPQANGLEVAVARPPARGHGVVTGAFVTAGSHVGGGFRTVGRTLRRVF
jgi:hypothetical protein